MALLALNSPTGETEKGVIQADPTKTVMVRNSWGMRYSGLADLPSPLDVSGNPYHLDEELIWMMLRDPQMFAGYMLWKTGILVDGIQIYPSKNTKDSNGKKSETREKKAEEFSEFSLYNLDNIKGSFHQKCLQILDCCAWGHKAAEYVYRNERFGRWKDKLVLNRIRMLPNNSYRIRTDNMTGEVVGLQPVGANGDDNIYDMSKFAFAVFRPIDDHPHGTNLFWPAYGAWYEKQQIAPERLSNMAMFGSPSMYATTPEGVTDIEMVDTNGMPLKYPDGHPKAGQTVRMAINKHMLDSLQEFQGNGSATVLPNSSEIKILQAQGDGSIFGKYSDDKNLEIIKAMFFTTSWTETEKYSSNAKGKVGASIGNFSLMDGKNMLADIFEEFCRNLIIYNYGEEFADLTPTVTFGSIEQGNLSGLYNAIAALWSTGFFDDSQRAVLCQKMNLPLPDPNAPRPQQGQPTGNVLVNNKEEEDDEDADKSN